MTKLEKQLKIEQDAHEYSYQKFLNELSNRISMGAGNELPEGTILIKTTIDVIANKLIEYFKAPLRGRHRVAREHLIDYYDRPHDLALLLLNVTISQISKNGSVKPMSLATSISQALHKNYIMMKLKDQHPKLYSYIEREYKKRGKGYIHSRKTKLGMMKATLNEDLLSDKTARLGTQLIGLIIKSGCNIIKKETVFSKGRRETVIKYTDEAFKLILKSRESIALSNKKYPIMILPPVPWSKLSGSLGYYSEKLYKGNAIKMRERNRKMLLKYTDVKPMDRYLNILNRLGNTKWRVNKRVYNILKEILDENIIDYASTKSNPFLVGGLPYNRSQYAEDYVDITRYGDIHTEGKYFGLPKDKQMYKEWYKATEIQKEVILVNRSKAISVNLAMIDAKRYVNEPEIYFSYQADSRGRIYPIQQHLNPQSKSEIKALLEFGEGVPIENEYQLHWFKIFGANCYGADKEEYPDRVKVIEDMEVKIKLIANDPIRYQEYWKDTDDPFRFLAWCFEYSDYLRDPVGFRSHISIGLDAVCSGIQIYSGLLKDRKGAESVNVINRYEKGKIVRGDIYTDVAYVVNKYLATGDYNKKIKFKQSDGSIKTSSTIAEADSMKGKVTRKLTKRNVMTQPYNVTTYGMYQQNLEILKEIEATGNVPWRGDLWVLAKLLTELNNRAIVATVEGARVGQEFLKDITKEIVHKGGYIFYTTPIIGFPVLHKVNKMESIRISTELGRLSIATYTDDIHSAKMVNGIAPNYIHSLDQTEMCLTIENMPDCRSFHMVHDDYGVPINQIQQLNEGVRKAYVELFESDPLLSFVRQVLPEWEDKVEDIMINTLDLKEVYDSAYIFS